MKKEVKGGKVNVVLSKTLGWIIITLLLVLDATLDIIFADGKGLKGHVFEPIANFLGISNPLYLTPLVLVLFYIVVKGGAWLAKKVDKVEFKAEELVLSTLVIVYGLFNLLLILFYLFNIDLISNRIYLILILIVVGIAYEWWAEGKLRR